MVTDRISKREALEQLAVAISADRVKPEIRRMVIDLFADHGVEFIRVRLKRRLAMGAQKERPILEPSNLFLELLAAAVANDGDKILAINHRIRSPSLGDKTTLADHESSRV